jgi:LacI family transcriptional regulator
VRWYLSDPTIRDVAERADVSKATVSAVLNNKATVNVATRERVERAVRELNYLHGADSRGRKGGVRIVGLLVSDIGNPYYAEIIQGAKDFLHERGYPLVVAASDGELRTEERIIKLFAHKEVDGLLLTPKLNRQRDLAHVFDLRRHNIPFVLVGEIRGIGVSMVAVDDVDGAKQAVRHLIELDHTRIIHFAGPVYSLHTEERVNGVRAAFSESRLVYSEDLVVPAGDSLEDGYRVGMEYFRDIDPCRRPTAVTCYNDLVALGLCRALNQLGLEVPDDVAVVGYDDLQLLDFVFPRLTSVRVPKREVGMIAAEILHREMQGNPGPPRKVHLKPELIVRASTCTSSAPRAEVMALGVVGG